MARVCEIVPFDRTTLVDFVLLLLLAALCCEARPLQESSTTYAAVNAAGEAAEARELAAGTLCASGTGCSAWDIKVNQGQASGVGVPTWAVQITNTCIDPRCTISNVIVQCGQFHSASLVNPAVFRRLDPAQGTCIVNNGNAIGNGQMVSFRYTENFKEPLTLKSAKVSCQG